MSLKLYDRPDHDGEPVLKALALGLILVLAGCASTAARVEKTEWSGHPVIAEMAADIERVGQMMRLDPAYSWACIKGRCQPFMPAIKAVNIQDRVTAGYLMSTNTMVLNIRVLAGYPEWARRVTIAHEMAHWLLRHESGWTCSGAKRLGCEIEANHESVRILSHGFGVPYNEAVDQVYVALATTVEGLKLPGHDKYAEIAAFRARFGCVYASASTTTCLGIWNPAKGAQS